MNEDRTVSQRDPSHCNLKPFGKNNKPNHTHLHLGGGKKKMHNIQMSNVKLKMSGWKVLAIPLKWKPASRVPQAWPAMGLSSDSAWASVPNLLTQCHGKEGKHTPPIYFILSEKNSISKNGVTSSVLVFRSFKWHKKKWRRAGREPKWYSESWRKQFRF